MLELATLWQFFYFFISGLFFATAFLNDQIIMAGARGGARIKRELWEARSKIADFELTSFMDGPLVSHDFQEVKVKTIWFRSGVVTQESATKIVFFRNLFQLVRPNPTRFFLVQPNFGFNFWFKTKWRI